MTFRAIRFSQRARRSAFAAVFSLVLSSLAGTAWGQAQHATLPRPNHPRIDEVLRLGDSEPAQAVLLWRKIIADLEKSPGSRSRETLAAKAWLADLLTSLRGDHLVEAIALARTVHDTALDAWGPDDDMTQRGRIVLGSALFLQGRYVEAQPILQTTLDHILAHPDAPGADMAASITRALATTYDYLGDPVRARETRSRVDATASSRILTGLEQSMAAAESAGDWGEAARLARAQAISLRESGAEGEAYAADDADLEQARALSRWGTPDALIEAESLVLGVRARRLADPREKGLTAALSVLATVLDRTPGRRAEVLDLLRDVAARQSSELGAGHPTTMETQMYLALTMALDGQDEAALNLLVSATNPGAGVILNRTTVLLLHVAGAMLALKTGDLENAYSMQAGAADVVRSNLTTGNRAAALDQTRDVFRTQVTLAYRYAAGLPLS